MLRICEGNTAKYHFTCCLVNISMFHFTIQPKKFLQFLLHVPEAILPSLFFFFSGSRCPLSYKNINYGEMEGERTRILEVLPWKSKYTNIIWEKKMFLKSWGGGSF